MLLSDDEINEVAIKVAAKLEGNTISRLIPHDVAEWLKGAIFDRSMRYQYVVPLAGSNAMVVQFQVDIDGSITITLSDQTNSPFWTGTLKELQ